MILDSEINRDEDLERRHRHEKDPSAFSATMIAVLVVVLLVTCSTCFGIGYLVGHYNTPSIAETPATQTASAVPAPVAAVPLIAAGATQASVASAAGTPVMQGVSNPPPSPPASTPTPQQTAATQPRPAAPAPTAKAPEQTAQDSKTKPSPSSNSKRSPSHPAEYAHHNDVARRPDPFMHLVSNPNYALDSSPSHQPMVQVAVLMREEDASVLVDALSRHGYSASADHTSDHRIHVRLGPFSSRTDASAMRDKLLNDGYNAVVQ
jgi:DedD protein